MPTHAEKSKETRNRVVANPPSRKAADRTAVSQFADNSPQSVQLATGQQIADDSPQSMQFEAIQGMADNSPQAENDARLAAMAGGNPPSIDQGMPAEGPSIGQTLNPNVALTGELQMKAEPTTMRRQSQSIAAPTTPAQRVAVDHNGGPAGVKLLNNLDSNTATIQYAEEGQSTAANAEKSAGQLFKEELFAQFGISIDEEFAETLQSRVSPERFRDLTVFDGFDLVPIFLLLQRGLDPTTIHALVATDRYASADVTRWLTAGRDPAVLHALVFVDRFDAAQITTLLTAGRDPALLHTLVSTDRFDATQINTLLTAGRDPALLHTLVSTDGFDAGDVAALITAGQDPALLQTLVNPDGFTPTQVVSVLATDPNAAAIHTLRTPDGFTPAEIIALLRLNHPAGTIHAAATTVVPGFTLPNIMYVTLSAGKIGSIYFGGGRVRLTHNDGPVVSYSPGINRFTISNDDYNLVMAQQPMGNLLFDRTPGDNVAVHAYVQRRGSFAVAAAGQGDRLVEFRGANGIGGWHFSRGGPKAFNYGLTQIDLNIIGNVAQLRNNATLRAWMRAVARLAAVPIN